MKAFFTILYFSLINTSFGQISNLSLGMWSNKTVWSNNKIPSINDSISLNYDIIIDINANCRVLNANGHTVTINAGFNLNVLGNNLPPDSTFIDLRDGQIYRFKHFGTQIWMTQNLNFVASGSWCYDNNLANCDVYGRLYDWNAATTVAPVGWHLPSKTEWETLYSYLGTFEVAGDNMKEAGYDHWDYWYYNSNGHGVATNSSGFTALPGGERDFSYGGSFYAIHQRSNFWSSTIIMPYYAYACTLQYSYQIVTTFEMGRQMPFALSVRCIKD